MEEKKDLEIVSGDGSSLDISAVHEHLNVAKPKCTKEKPTDIVIPKEKKKKENDEKKEEKKEEN